MVGVVWTRRSIRMELDGESRIQAMPQPFYRAIVNFHVGDQQGVRVNAVRIDGVTVVLTGEINAAGCNFTNRMIEPAVAVFHFEGIGAICQCK